MSEDIDLQFKMEVRSVGYVVETEVQVSNGKYSPPMLYLLKAENDYIALQSKKGKFPNKISSEEYKYDKDMFWKKIPEDLYLCLRESILSRKNDWKYFDNFTYICAYCKARGFDLKENIFST